MFTTWILKHGVTNPFKHGVHYIDQMKIRKKKDFHQSCMVIYQTNDWIEAGVHVGEWSKAFNPLKLLQKVLSVIVCIPSPNKTLKIIQWAFIFQIYFLVDL